MASGKWQSQFQGASVVSWKGSSGKKACQTSGWRDLSGQRTKGGEDV